MSVTATNASYELPEEDAVLDVLRAFGVRRAQLFGSAARRELTPESNIGLLVDIADAVDYGVIFRLTEALEAATGRPFDVLTSIRAPFRPFIEPELVELPL